MPAALAEAPPRIATPLLAGIGAACAVLAARAMMAGALPSVTCWWLRGTGLPCPGCGGTRCLAACARLDIGGAFFWNPLAALAVCAFIGWSALALADRRLADQAGRRLGGWFTRNRIAAIVALNWLYLCLALPR